MAGPYTVTATLNTVAGSASPLVGNAFVRFRLRNFDGYVPQVSGTAVVVESQLDAFPNSSGVISQTVWGNSDISPANTFYTIEWWNSGRLVTSGNWTINANTNLNTAAQLNPPPGPAAPYTIAFENNGALNSSQILLNLVNGTGTTVVDDGNGAVAVNAGGSSFSTAGQGGFWSTGSVDNPEEFNSGATTIVTSPNEVRVMQFVLQSSFTITKVTFWVTGNTGSSATANVGIYSAAGNVLLDSGAITIANAFAGIKTASVSPTVFPPGTYFFVQSGSSGNIQLVGAAGASDGVNLLTVINNAHTRYGLAANSVSAGALPATLGTITRTDTTTGNNNTGTALAFFEP